MQHFVTLRRDDVPFKCDHDVGVNIRDLGAKLTQFRETAELTMEGLAIKSGVAKNAILAIEKGRGNPTVQTLDALSRALEVHVTSFFELPTKKMQARMDAQRSLKPPPDVDDAFSFLSRYRDLPEERKRLVAMFVYGDPSYLGTNPALARAVEQFLAKPKLKK